MKMFGRCLADYKKEISKTLQKNVIEIVSVLKAGLEPARALLPTGF